MQAVSLPGPPQLHSWVSHKQSSTSVKFKAIYLKKQMMFGSFDIVNFYYSNDFIRRFFVRLHGETRVISKIGVGIFWNNQSKDKQNLNLAHD